MGKSSGTGQHGPRDTATVLASRYVLTDKGEAAVVAIRALSGWCGQRGRPDHAGCKVACACECHRGDA